MRAPLTCQIEGCTNPVIVGIGPGPVWVCSKHFDEAMAGISEAVTKSIKRLITAQWN